tara:strand:+ start:17014 stop:17301 length:288 start_codon:yes stop_codon:yes gene_type:complete
MSVVMKVSVGVGIAVMVVSGSIVGGIIAKVINDGEHNKEDMTTSPPPPSPPSSGRRLSEHDEIYGQRGSQFDLTREERDLFTTLAVRQMAAGMKR